MRLRRASPPFGASLCAFLVVLGTAAAALAVACGSDSISTSGSSSGGGSAFLGDSGRDGAEGPQRVSANASPLVVYLGRSVDLDGSKSTGPAGLAYAWTLTSAPSGSAITNGSLIDRNSARATFTPDRAGSYAFRLTVTADATASVDVVVDVIDPPIFYFRTSEGAGTHEGSLNVVGAGGAEEGTTVSCFSRPTAAGPYDTNRVGLAGADWWEAPAGQASRVVFVSETRVGDLATGALSATTSSATCSSQPNALDSFPGDPGVTRVFEQPRFSANGERIVYVRTESNRSRIMTVGFDGAGRHEVAPLGALANGSPDPDAGVPSGKSPPRPIWIGPASIAWLQTLDDAHWQIVSAPDQDGATPTLVMSCTGSSPDQFDILPSGDVLVTQPIGEKDTTRVTNLLAYPVTATKECGTARNLSNLTSMHGGSVASDFSVSPDKTRIAYSHHEDMNHTLTTMVVPVDGSSPPMPIAGTFGGTNRGPRWVGAGAFLTWGVFASEFDAGLSGNAIAVTTADGGVARRLASGPAGTTTQAISNGRCSFAQGPGGVFGWGALSGVVGVMSLLARRRRRA